MAHTISNQEFSKTEVKVRFVDFWDDLNDLKKNPIIKFIENRFKITISENPDFLFFSTNGYEHTKYDCIKIFFTGEQCSPDFDLSDYAIGYDYLDFGDRYLRFPLFALSYSSEKLSLIDKQALSIEESKLLNKNFCSFVYSNFKETSGRDVFFHKLNSRERVVSGGKHLNNLGFRVTDKIKFSTEYKFSIAYENSVYPGYTTEKIIDSFNSNSLPIYYGNSRIVEDFNENTFINLHNYKNIDDAIDHIIQIHQNPEVYLQYFKELRFKPSIYLYEDKIRSFLIKILSQTAIDARRRSNSYYVINKKNMLRRLRMFYRLKNQLSKLALLKNSYHFIQKIFNKSNNKRI